MLDKLNQNLVWILACSLLLGVSHGETGQVVTVDGTNRTLLVDFVIGETGPDNVLNVVNGGVLNNVDGFVGLGASADGNQANVTGAGSSWNNAEWNLGFFGADNRAMITAGGKITSEGDAFIGRASGADQNQLWLDGVDSLLEVGGSLTLGNAGKSSQLVVSNEAAVLVTTDLILGNGAGSTGNRLIIESGSLRVPNGTFRLGNQGEGALQLYGGLLQVNQFMAKAGARSLIEFSAGELDANNLEISTGSPLVVGDGSSAAVLRLGATSHILEDGLHIAAGATLHGQGDLVGAISSDGTVEPGEGVATFTIYGSASLSASATLGMDLGGLQAGIEHDELLVNGAASLGGTLALTLQNGFRPAEASQIVLVRAQSVTGTFANAPDGARITSLDGSGSFQVNYTAQTVVISGFIPSSPLLEITALRITSTTLELDLVGLVPNTLTRVFGTTDLLNDPLNTATEIDTFTPTSADETWIGTPSGSFQNYFVIQD
jgi:T5SS/PEP-CTERM-associated repeat protein